MKMRIASGRRDALSPECTSGVRRPEPLREGFSDSLPTGAVAFIFDRAKTVCYDDCRMRVRPPQRRFPMLTLARLISFAHIADDTRSMRLSRLDLEARPD